MPGLSVSLQGVYYTALDARLLPPPAPSPATVPSCSHNITYLREVNNRQFSVLVLIKLARVEQPNVSVSFCLMFGAVRSPLRPTAQGASYSNALNSVILRGVAGISYDIVGVDQYIRHGAMRFYYITYMLPQAE